MEKYNRLLAELVKKNSLGFLQSLYCRGHEYRKVTTSFALSGPSEFPIHLDVGGKQSFTAHMFSDNSISAPKRQQISCRLCKNGSFKGSIYIGVAVDEVYYTTQKINK